MGAFVRRHFQEVLAVPGDGAARYLIVVLARENISER